MGRGRRGRHERVVKRYHPPGTSPGTVAPPVEAAAAALTLYTYTPGGVEESHPPTVQAAAASFPAGAKAWLRVVGHDAAVLEAIAGRWGVHPLVLEDIVNVGQRTKLEDYGAYLFLVVDVLRAANASSLEEEQISLLLFDRLVISVQERESGVFRLVEERLRADRGKMRVLGSDYLAYALVDAAVDHYFPVLEAVGERIEDAEEALLGGRGPASLDDLHRLRRDLLRLRKAAWPLRDMTAALARSESPLIGEGMHVWLRDVYDHTVQVIDIVENFREMTASLLDLHLSAVSNRLNEVMKFLTMIATIFIPLTFIVGVYGMNFDPGASPWNMPELRWYWGYPAVWALMLLAGGGMVYFFRRRRWL